MMHDSRYRMQEPCRSMQWSHCTPRALPLDDCVILQGASLKGLAISFLL